MSFSFDMGIPMGYFVENEAEARQWLQYFLASSKVVGGLGLDSETTGLDIVRDRVVIWSISDGAQRITLPAKFLEMFREAILESPDIDFDMSNPKFDMHMFKNSGIDLSRARSTRDTVVQSWLNNENNIGRNGLKETVEDIFHRTTPTFTQTFGKPVRKNGVTIVSPGDLINAAMSDPARRVGAADYASLDAYNSAVVRRHFDNVLEGMKTGTRFRDLYQYFYQIEVPFTKVLWKCERRGFGVDRVGLEALKGPMSAEMGTIEAEFAQAAGRPINLNSLNDVRFFFFQLCKKTPISWTTGGSSGNKQPSTDADTLDTWAGEGDPWANKMLRFRSIAKLKGTYVDGLGQWLDPADRIHTTLKQTGAATGRLSSAEPNLQNISAHDEFGIRKLFKAPPGKKLLVADYSQVEMRLAAHVSQDERMLEAIRNNIDLHCFTVSEAYGIPLDVALAAKKHEGDLKKGKTTEPMSAEEHELMNKRSAMKKCGFGILYGIMGPHLAADLTKETGKLVTPQEGTALINRWLNVFPGIRRELENTKKQIWRDGYVQTISGRFRRFADLSALRKGDQARAERQSFNARIQGSSADVTRMAMLLCEEDSVLKSLNTEMLLSVHDELIFEVPDNKEIYEQAKVRVKQLMEYPYSDELSVVLTADPGVAATWGEAK